MRPLPKILTYLKKYRVKRFREGENVLEIEFFEPKSIRREAKVDVSKIPEEFRATEDMNYDKLLNWSAPPSMTDQKIVDPTLPLTGESHEKS